MLQYVSFAIAVYEIIYCCDTRQKLLLECYNMPFTLFQFLNWEIKTSFSIGFYQQSGREGVLRGTQIKWNLNALLALMIWTNDQL